MSNENENDLLDATVSAQLQGNSDSKLNQLLDYKIAQGKTPGIIKHLKSIEESSEIIAKEIDKISLAEAQIKKDLGSTSKITVNRASTRNWNTVTSRLNLLEKGQMTVDMADIALQIFNKG